MKVKLLNLQANQSRVSCVLSFSLIQPLKVKMSVQNKIVHTLGGSQIVNRLFTDLFNAATKQVLYVEWMLESSDLSLITDGTT